jgi:hypothetical protein
MKAFKLIFGLLAMIQVASAKIIYVDDDASAGGDGSSWSSAHKYLQDALAISEAGDEVWVAEGTYKPDQGNGITAGEASVYLKCLGILGAKDAVMNLKQMESLSNNVEVLDLPFEVRE